MIHVAPGTIAVYGDIACPWAHLATHRLFAARDRLGVSVSFDMRPFPLEVVNEQCTPRRTLAAEIPVAGALDPGAGWQMWQSAESNWPVTTLLAMEAVEAAKEQSLDASASLAYALRRALFGQSRCVSMRHVILEVAHAAALDVDALREALDAGRHRRTILEPVPDEVQGSPHLFLPDGTDAPNPGIEMHWEGEHGRGFPVVDSDDPSVYDELLERAATSAVA